MSEYIIDMGNSSYKSQSGLLCADASQLREEIVRCRDCKHFCRGNNDFPHTCNVWRAKEYARIEPDGYCKWGERK